MSEEPPAPPQVRAPARSRRYAPAILLVGAAAVAYFVLPGVPRERSVDLRVADAAAVAEVGVVWSQDMTPVHGERLRFPGGAPPVIRTTVSLPDGEYQLDVTIAYPGRPAPPEWAQTRRVVTLDRTSHLTLRIP